MSELQQYEVAATPTDTEDTFSALLKRSFRPSSEDKTQAIERAIGTLAEWALRNTELLSDDTRTSINALIAKLDEMITTQLNEILHAPEVQQLESAWRGLHFLVNKTETDEMLKIRVMPLAKRELRTTLRRFKGSAWDMSPLFKKIYEEEYGVLGGQPYGCIVGDYAFDHSPADCETLGEMAKIAAAAHAPFISSAAPSLMGFESWGELSNPRDLAGIFNTPEYAAWKSLRCAEDSRYVALALPRFLARLPYGAKSDPVAEFDFEEDTAGGDPSRFVWANSAYAMASNITRAFKLYGWCSRIRGVESGGAVEGLPTYVFPTADGTVDMACPTEIAISDRRENELAKCGLMPLLHRKGTDMAAFIGAQSLHMPAAYDDPDATANAELSARLPYLFASCRFAHYLKAMVRDKIGGSFNSSAALQEWLQRWISGRYVHSNPKLASESDKARKPLAEAKVVVTDIEGNPGYYHAQFLLKPHYQLEGLTVSLRLVSRLKSQNK